MVRGINFEILRVKFFKSPGKINLSPGNFLGKKPLQGIEGIIGAGIFTSQL